MKILENIHPDIKKKENKPSLLLAVEISSLVVKFK